jgi:uncharacterized protein (DUF736 family)
MVPDATEGDTTMATTIATLTEKTDGSLEGIFATIKVNAPIALIPNAQKASEGAPDYRIIHRRTGFEIGAGWYRSSQRTGEEYLSVKLEAPEIGVIFGNVAPAPGGEANRKVILWNDPA